MSAVKRPERPKLTAHRESILTTRPEPNTEQVPPVDAVQEPAAPVDRQPVPAAEAPPAPEPTPPPARQARPRQMAAPVAATPAAGDAGGGRRRAARGAGTSDPVRVAARRLVDVEARRYAAAVERVRDRADVLAPVLAQARTAGMSGEDLTAILAAAGLEPAELPTELRTHLRR